MAVLPSSHWSRVTMTLLPTITTKVRPAAVVLVQKMVALDGADEVGVDGEDKLASGCQLDQDLPWEQLQLSVELLERCQVISNFSRLGTFRSASISIRQLAARTPWTLPLETAPLERSLGLTSAALG